MPFGEYLPFQHLLESLGLQQLTKAARRISGRRPPQADCRAGRSAGAAADLLRDHLSGRGDAAGPRPGWIVNVTNDGWFGISQRPLPAPPAGAAARDRARAAAGSRRQYRHLRRWSTRSGASSASLPLGSEGVIDSPLPRPVALRFTPASAMPRPSSSWRWRCLRSFGRRLQRTLKIRHRKDKIYPAKSAETGTAEARPGI